MAQQALMVRLYQGHWKIECYSIMLVSMFSHMLYVREWTREKLVMFLLLECEQIT